MNKHTFYNLPFDDSFKTIDYTLGAMSAKSTYCLNTCLNGTEFTKSNNDQKQKRYEDDFHNKRYIKNKKTSSTISRKNELGRVKKTSSTESRNKIRPKLLKTSASSSRSASRKAKSAKKVIKIALKKIGRSSRSASRSASRKVNSAKKVIKKALKKIGRTSRSASRSASRKAKSAKKVIKKALKKIGRESRSASISASRKVKSVLKKNLDKVNKLKHTSRKTNVVKKAVNKPSSSLSKTTNESFAQNKNIELRNRYKY